MRAKCASSGCHAGSRIDHEQDDIGFVDRRLGLEAHARLEALIGRVLVAGCVEHVEMQIADAPARQPPVAGHARRVVDKRDFLADQAIEQC